MSDPVAAIARAVLYEGFALYPYRASSLKNQQRYFFGGVYPPAWAAASSGDPDVVGAQMLLHGFDYTVVSGSVRFLQFDAEGGAVERAVEIPECAIGELTQHPRTVAFDLGLVVLSARPVDEAFRIELRVCNTSTHLAASRDEALRETMASLHAVLRVAQGAWVSLLEPPPALSVAAVACRQDGLHPVLVGREGSRDTLLVSPIVLYDYPRVAPESAGDLFDGTEIDEILTLRLQTLADSELDELSRAEPRVREMLERARSMSPDDLRRLHGALRDPAVTVAPGSRVRIKPRERGDVMDLALAGRSATVTAVERDFDGRVHIAVVVDDDPGADLGAAGFHGHRFFFEPGEVEAL